MKIYLTNATAILESEIVHDAAVLIEGDRIVAVNPLSSGTAQEVDLGGATLMPGLIDLHCDALEKEIEPRPGVHFPLSFALGEMDKRNAMAGITTPYHAISFAGAELGMRSNALAAEIAEAIDDFRPRAMLDHRIHCRYEITDPEGQSVLTDLMEAGRVDLISLMDHTPGQGQFKELSDFQAYLSGVYGKSADEISQIVEKKFANQGQATGRIEGIVAVATQNHIPVASHDDDSPERLQWMHALGVGISEFPINLEVTQKAQELGLATLFGAPNLLRGQSQSGSMKAAEAIEHDIADVLCSDYAPSTLLPALFLVANHEGWDLARATKLVTINPANALGLDDRGSITAGQRADLIAVQNPGEWPQVLKTWSRGQEVYRSGGG